MTDISTLLHHAAGTIDATPGADLAGADLHRGRRAASRLRTRRIATRGTGVAALATLALIVGVSTLDRGASPAIAATLVSYTGAQPAGYLVDTVPQGWTVENSNQSFLVIAPVGAPPANKSGSPDIIVSWQAYAGPLPGAEPVQVGSVAGTYGDFGDPTAPGTMGLQYRDAADHNIMIQIPATLHWSAAQAATFAEGIHVTDAVA